MNRKFRLLLSVLTGVLLSLAWLEFPGWTLFIAFFPLLLLDQYFVENKASYKSVSFWGYAFLSFFIWNGITTWWIAYATVVGAFLAIVANSFLMSLVWWLGHAARRRFKPNLGYIALIAFWISFEYFHFHWDIEWPWLIIGNGFANNIKLIQWFEYTGVLGGTLWVLAVNVILFSIYRKFINKNSFKPLVYPFTALTLLIVVPMIISYIIYNSYTEKSNPVNVVIVQPNIDPYSESYDFRAEEEKLQKFINLASGVITEQTDLVIGPETVFERWPDWNINRLNSNILYRQLNDWILSYPDAELIFGASTHKLYPGADSASSTSRVSNGTYYDVFNSAVFIGRQGAGQVYHKSVLVPGVEKMPFRNYLSLMNDVVFDLGGTTGSLGRMEEPSNFVLKRGVEAAPVICYESVFGGYLAQFIRKGAEMIVVITNDGWWRNTPGYKQHLSFSRLRAIETRRSVARAANTGISCFINQRGDVYQMTPWWTETAIAGDINLNDEITFYVRYSDFIARISMFAGALLLLFLAVKSIIRE
jgi:apolipoprotein N-acyltransferase